MQVPLTKSQKQAAKKKSQTPVVKAAKSDALKKAKLARVSLSSAYHFHETTTDAVSHCSTIQPNRKLFSKSSKRNWTLSRKERREQKAPETSGNRRVKERTTTKRIRPTTPISRIPIPKRRTDRSGNSLRDPSTNQHRPSPNYEINSRNESRTFRRPRNLPMDLPVRKRATRLESTAKGPHSRGKSCWSCEGSREVSFGIIDERRERRSEGRRSRKRLNESLVTDAKVEEKQTPRRRSLARSSRTTRIDRGKSRRSFLAYRSPTQ